MNQARPIRKPGVSSQGAGGAVILYSAKEDVIHSLNKTARLIWQMCDGTHSVEDMEAEIRKNYAVHDGCDVADDIRKVLQVLMDKGLLETESAQGTIA